MTVITGRTWVFGDSVDTDAMYPAHAMKLELPQAARHMFHEIRPGWPDLVEPGDIVVAGSNFGVGSSRPVAALFLQLGVAALLAAEFNSLFFRNAINAGLPALTVPDATRLFRDGDTATLDLTTGVCRNDTTGATARTAPLPPMIREILASGGLLARLADQGYLPAHLAPALRAPAAHTLGGSGS
jgi:3-isopropylmalate/(R)-2-methylmalate dehydratase small subunit